MYRGSARIALDVEPAFNHYLFIEESPDYIRELSTLRQEYPNKEAQIDIRQGEANSELQRWCREVDWNRHRAVVFLDPYGMAVEWKTVETLAQTKSVDLWLLFPLGQAINRLLPRQGPPTGAWADRLTRFFGTNEWKEAFYRPSLQGNFFEQQEPEYEKLATFQSISDFFVERLDTVFEKVADESLWLENSKGVPIFVLFFAASNPQGAATAVRIASDILRS